VLLLKFLVGSHPAVSALNCAVLGVLTMPSDNPWENPSYLWVVICRNTKAHKSENMMFGHRIPLAETDAFEPLAATGSLMVQCDGCRQEYVYEPSEIVRVEMEAPEGFTTHPRFL